MIYEAYVISFRKLLGNWKAISYWGSVGLLILFGGLAYKIYYGTNLWNSIAFLLIVSFLSLRFIAIAIFKGISDINRIIHLIEVDQQNILIQTFGVSFFGGLIAKDPIRMEFDPKVTRFKMSTRAYFTKNKNLLNNVYLLQNDSVNYFLVDNLFDNFSTLKQELEVATQD